MEIIIILTVLAFIWVSGLKGMGRMVGKVMTGIVGLFKKSN